jgi:hypothetical protein
MSKSEISMEMLRTGTKVDSVEICNLEIEILNRIPESQRIGCIMWAVCVYYCSTYKAVRGEGDSGGHVL